MHVGEWPTFFGDLLMDEAREKTNLTEDERREFDEIKKEATRMGRIEKIFDGTLRRRYHALRLKEARG